MVVLDYILLAINALVLALLIALLLRKNTNFGEGAKLDALRSEILERFAELKTETRQINVENRKEINEIFTGLQQLVLERIQENLNLQKEQLGAFSLSLDQFKNQLNESFHRFTLNNNENFEKQNKQMHQAHQFSLEGVRELRATIEKQLEAIRRDNEKQLGEMRITVDEKLQSTLEKRLGESFKQVSDRLEQVHKGLGEMQQIATGVGDLKKVLSNVKTRGVLGEFQLGNILEQILTPNQYAQNVATKKGSQANVEYAVKLPGKDADKDVWMPIDSKFPIENYELLLGAYDKGDAEDIAVKQNLLLKRIESFAKDISSKYIDPPHTTDFGIMFLPIESLYAEVLRHPGLFETLQNKYKITVTGPTTLSALLNSLQMGFRTLAVQKRSSEVWDILKAVKTEFGKFSEQLAKVQKQLHTASGSLESLQTTRTSQIERKLRSVETLDTKQAESLLELPKEDQS